MGKKSKRRQPADTAATSSSASANSLTADARLRIGDRVTLAKLKSTQYNGKVGSIVSLPKLGDKDERYGVRLDDKSAAPIAIRRENIEKVKNWRSTEQQLEERKRSIEGVVESNDENMNADQMQMMRMMMNMFMTEKNQIEVFGRKLEPMPNFHQELLKGGGFPSGVDKIWADNYLRTAFEQANNLPHFMEYDFKRAEYKPEPRDILKRLNTNHPEKLKWYYGPRFPGNIFPQFTGNAYPGSIRHSYSNQAYRSEILQQGTTHVAVGFVDLGILFAGTLRGQQHGPPLRFVGIELSSYAVAKTHVIWQMLKHTPLGDREDHLRHIMQVWFSTTLDKGAVDAVKSALNALCDASKQKSFHTEVKNLLAYWNSATTTAVADARSQHKRFTSAANSYIGDLQRKCDRIAMGKYEITGDFGLKSIPYAGNTLMFDCPDGTAPHAMNETIFSAFDWKEVVKLMSQTNTLLDAAEIYALSNLSKLADWVLQERVVVELFCSKIENMVEDVAVLKPWTMSWSNVIDYVDHKDFHRMARACSAHGDTVHFAYSMNWASHVWGTNLIDFQGKEKTDLRTQIIESANDEVEKAYKMFGWDKYLRLPPPINPINTTSIYGLEMMHYGSWVEKFFSIAKREGPCEMGMSEHVVGSPISPTGSSTVGFTWTYDPDVKFNHSIL